MAKTSKKQQAANAKPGSNAEPSQGKKAKKSGTKKADSKKASGKKAEAQKTRSRAGNAPDIAAVAKTVKAKAVDLASNPLVAEVVAATLVAAAAAIKDPNKARAIANSVGDELGKAAKGAQGGSAMWQLAMDVAKRSMSALAEGSNGAGAPKPKAKRK